MRHEWVLDVLSDLVTYAERNGLPRLAEKAGDALRQAEIDLGLRQGVDRAPTADRALEADRGGRAL